MNVKKIIIDENLITYETSENGMRIISFSNAKQCSQCLNIKDNRAFWHHNTNIDNLNIRCGICCKKNIQDKKVKKIQKIILNTSQKIGLRSDHKTKAILEFVKNTNDLESLRKIEKSFTNILFKQNLNDDKLNEIIKGQI